MRKLQGLGLLITLCSALLVGMISSPNGFMKAQAENEIDAQIFSVQVRSDQDNNHFVVIQDQLINSSASSVSIANTSDYNAPDYVKIFMNENDEGILLSSIIADKAWSVNLWSSQGVMFPLSTETYQTYNGASIYAIEILEGCTYPNNNSQTLINRADKKYINQHYGDASYKNESFKWTYIEEYKPTGDNIALFGAQVRADVDGNLYYLCVSSSLYLEKQVKEYPDISMINAYEKIKVYLNANDEGKTLSEIASLRSGCQNKWSSTSFHFTLTAAEYEIYNGASIYQIVIEEGCELLLDGKIYVTPEKYIYQNRDYGDESHKYGAFHFDPALERDNNTKLSLYSAEVRGDADANEFYIDLKCELFLALEPKNYVGVDSHINAYDKIKIYLSSTDEGKLLSQVTSLRKVSVNKWSSSAFMFALTAEEYEIYNGTTIYMVEVLEGCELIYNDKICEVDKSVAFMNSEYGKDSVKYSAFHFISALTRDNETKIDLFGAEVRGDADANEYYIDLRCELFLNSSPTLYRNVDLFINAYSHIKIYLNEEDEGKTLGEITSIRDAYLNKWSSSAFMFKLSTEEYEIYNGTSIYMIEVLEGCEFIYNNKICQVSKPVLYMNSEYGKESAKYSAFHFITALHRNDETTLDIFTAEVRGDVVAGLYFIDIKCELFLSSEPTEYKNVDTFINAYSHIKVYLSPDDEGKTLGEITSIRDAYLNKWSSSAFMFGLNIKEYDIYNGTTIYMIEVLEGCELIYNNEICKVTSPVSYVNIGYGKESAMYSAFNFTPALERVNDTKLELFGAEVRADEMSNLYYIDLKCSLYLPLDDKEYFNVDVFINAYDKIKIYLNEHDFGKTLGDITRLRNAVENKWESSAFLFALASREYEIYNGTSIYMIEVLEDCELICDNKIYKVDKGYEFINNDYGKESAYNEAFNFSLKGDDPIYLGTINVINIHNRMDKDSNQRWLMFLFDSAVFDTTAVINNWINKTNFLDSVLIWSSKNSEPFTLRDIYDDENGTGITLKQFGESNMIGVTIKNDKDENGYLYDCAHMYKVMLKADAQIPTYENGINGYRLLSDKTVLTNDEYGKTGPIPDTKDDFGNLRLYEEWNLFWSVIYVASFEVRGLDNVSFEDISLEPGQRVYFDYFAKEGYDLDVTTKDGEKVYQCIIGLHQNVDYILTYTVHKDDGSSSSSKKCGGDIIMTSILLSTLSLFGAVAISLKKKEGNENEK